MRRWSAQQVSPREVGIDPLMALGPRLDPLKRANVDNMCLALGLADRVQAVAVFRPLEADALDLFTGDSGRERANHFFSNHAQQTGVFITLVNAVAGCLVDQVTELCASWLARRPV